MEWVSDVSAGVWLRERLDDPWQATMHDVVPRGFDAYARVLHPTTRSRPVGRPWPPAPESEHRRAWREFERDRPDIDDAQVGWGQAAAAFGTTLHPLAQWRHLVRESDTAEAQPRDAAGWAYDPPPEGDPPPALLSALAATLADHTATPTEGHVGIWDGFGGLVGFLGEGPARTTLAFGGAVTLAGMPERYTDEPRHRRFLQAIRRDVFRSPFRKPTWQPGLLPDDVSRGPRLDLPNRSHVLFRSGIDTFVAEDWPDRMPWAQEELYPVQAPSLIWPQDRAWVLVSEIDWDFTIVAGSAALIAALVDDPALEAFPIPPESRLGWDDDPVNG